MAVTGGKEARMLIKDVMTTEVVTVEPETSLKEAALALARNGISGVPVVGPAGEVLGVLSEADVIAKERTEPKKGGILKWLVDPADPWLQDRFEATTAGEAMSAPAITITPDRPVSAAAAAMLDEGVNRLPVVDDDGRLVGLVSRGDLVKSFVRSDEEIRTEIEEAVVRRILWLDGATVQVKVDKGVVALGGQVETEQDAQLLETFARRVPGVVSVTSSVKWRVEANA
jgi:CBS domain-containing protein